MPNPYFQFKQFIIHQDKCAMKVCTDACILGAWCSQKISSYPLVLDIGSGTGLLMLMLAQKHKGQIHGIELEPSCFEQLRDNIQQSKWKDKLQVFPGDARSFAFPNNYDLIISNPPFFEGELNAETETSNLAKHSKELTLSALMEIIDANLAPAAGTFTFGKNYWCGRRLVTVLSEPSCFSPVTKKALRR
jgi:tRNA1Val (adenine37-N6)-methyltransferase